MSSRSVAILAAVFVGGAVWIFISDRKTPIAQSSESTEEMRKSSRSRVRDASPSKSAVEHPSLVTPTQLNEDRRKLDETLQLFSGNTSTDTTNTAQALINLLPELTRSGQMECAEHITNLLSNEEYPRALPIWVNPASDPDVVMVFATDLLNRPARVMMPAMLDAIKMRNHPYHDEAKRTMQNLLDHDHGDNIPQWENSMNSFLENEATEISELAPSPSQ